MERISVLVGCGLRRTATTRYRICICLAGNTVAKTVSKRAALELFDEQGFEKTSVIEISERAGVTTRTFFRYFSASEKYCSPEQTTCAVSSSIRYSGRPTSKSRSG
jgi:transcriptional regulator GlxA family with amidase domain